jgi:hypothetical protein
MRNGRRKTFRPVIFLGRFRKVNRCKGEGLELNSKEGFVFVRGGYKECAQDAS